jgi:hypothetical protein
MGVVALKFLDYIDGMYELVSNEQNRELENRYYQICFDVVGKNIANKIQQINLVEFKELIQEGLEESLTLAENNPKIKAIYYEYDFLNLSSDFFACKDYRPISANDDDWACEWKDVIDGPDLDFFEEIYNHDRNQYDNGKEDVIEVYLIARLLSAFIEVIRKVESNIPICIAYHDQDPIMRVRE